MGRLNRTNIPQLDHRRTSNLDRFREKEDLLKQRQKRNFDRRHIAKSLDLLEKGDKAWISDMKKYGEIVSTAAHPVPTTWTPKRNRPQESRTSYCG